MKPEEETQIQKFVCQQLSDAPDISALTLGIIRRQYLSHVGRESLSPEAKQFMKKVVQEELMKMQDPDEEDGESVKTATAVIPQKKRKREEENEETSDGKADDTTVSQAKKSRLLSSSSASEMESAGKKTSKTSESRPRRNDDDEDQNETVNGEDMAGEGSMEVETNESSDNQQKIKGETANKSGVTKGRKIAEKHPSPSQKSSDDGKKNDAIKGTTSDHDGSSVSSGEDGKKELPLERKGSKQKTPEELKQDSDSSSSSSLEDDSASEKDKKETVKKRRNVKSKSEKETTSNHNSSDSSEEDDEEKASENSGTKKEPGKKGKNVKPEASKDKHKAVLRLKRYINVCGGRKPYKKLLGNCRSVRQMVAILSKELEELGVKGRPTIEKCKKVKRKRERAKEVAELDVRNIIVTPGRPERAASAWQKKHVPQSNSYTRTVKSSSDSDGDGQTARGGRRTDWSNLQGIISDGGDSD